MHIGVIGAGPAGLSCALRLAEAGHQVTIFEADTAVGGLSKSFELWEQIVDLGPHRFFSKDVRVKNFWLAQVEESHVQVERLTRIFYNNKFYFYPLKPFDALLKLGFSEALHCGMSFIKNRMFPSMPEEDFERWVSNRFGRRLYEIFFKAYSEKLWGIPCTELDADFAAQRIKGLNLYEAVKHALSKGRNIHKTLVDQFAYPVQGCGQPYKKMARKITALGGRICLSTPVEAIIAAGNKATGIKTVGGEEYKVDHVVSTAPFTDMACSISTLAEKIRPAAEKLAYRNTTLVYVLVNNLNVFSDNWIYVHSANLHTGRITNFRNWAPDMQRGSNQSILALEYWSNDGDPLWKCSDIEMAQMARQELAATGLVPDSDIIDTHIVRLHRSYPIYNKGYKKWLSEIQEAVSDIQNLYFIGRNGAFKYNNQDHSILMGLLTAENIMQGNKYNLWTINTDYDYQESELIIARK